MSLAKSQRSPWAQALALFRRELLAYFLSPMIYLVWAVFLIASGYLFATTIRDGAPLSLDETFANMSFLLIFVVPLLTMRLVAEELRLGTLELLFTDPLSDATIVLAKFCGAVCFFAVMMAPTLAYPAILAATGQPDLGPIAGGYVGLFLMGSLFVAAGLCASALTSHQIAAAAASFTLLLLLWVLGRAGASLAPGISRDVLDYLSTFSRFAAFRRGLVDTRSLVYFVSLTVLLLFGAVRALGLRRLQ